MADPELVIVFDDSSVANHQQYYPLLEKTKTWNDVFYVGPKEKEPFIELADERLRDRKLQSAVRHLFRPSYARVRNARRELSRYSVSACHSAGQRVH